MRASRTLALAVLALGLAVGGVGCAGTGKVQDPALLEGTEWQLVAASVSSQDLSAAGITAVFDGTRVGGFSGVNQYGGSYEAGADGSFEIGELTSTLMAGSTEMMAAEDAYIALLKECDGYQVTSGGLSLLTGEQVALSYEPAAEVKLPGSSWTITNYNNGTEAVVSPIEGSNLLVTFNEDAKISGDAGVNTFLGPYIYDEKTLTVGPLATTKKTASEELMAQEQQVIAALRTADEWSITQGKLELRSSDGALQLVGVPR